MVESRFRPPSPIKIKSREKTKNDSAEVKPRYPAVPQKPKPIAPTPPPLQQSPTAYHLLGDAIKEKNRRYTKPNPLAIPPQRSLFPPKPKAISDMPKTSTSDLNGIGMGRNNAIATSNRIRETALLMDLTDTAAIMEYGNSTQAQLSVIIDNAMELSLRNQSTIIGKLSSIHYQLSSVGDEKPWYHFSKSITPIKKIKKVNKKVKELVDDIQQYLPSLRSAIAEVDDMVAEITQSIMPKMDEYLSIGEMVLTIRTVPSSDQIAMSNFNHFGTRIEALRLFRVSVTTTIGTIMLMRQNCVTLLQQCTDIIFNVIGAWQTKCIILLSSNQTPNTVEQEHTARANALTKIAKALKTINI